MKICNYAGVLSGISGKLRRQPLRASCVICGEETRHEDRSWSDYYRGWVHVACIPSIVRRRGLEAERCFLEYGPGDELTRMFTTEADARRGYRGIGSSL